MELLPRIHAQEAELDPVVYARYALPSTFFVWYVTEGQPDGEDSLLFGFILGPDQFCFFRLSELKAARSPLGQPVERDLHFEPGRFTDVVEAKE